MKEKGFTLIELLAVIVLLAIIALIATPIVLNIIEDSKASSKLNSANHYIDAVEQAIVKYNMNSAGRFIPEKCKIQENGNLKCDGKDITVEVDGAKPTSGKIIFVNGKIDDVGLSYGDKYIVDDEKGTLIYGTPPKTYYANGDPVFYNVDTGKTCLESEAVSTTGTKSGCMKFYAFNDTKGNETVNLILDHNTTATVAWNSSGSNASGPSEVLTQLYSDTKNWVGTIKPEDYTMDQSTQTSGANYTVTYSAPPTGETEAYKARLITAQEVAQITGADVALSWDETLSASGDYYFHDLSQTSSTGRGDVCASEGCTYGWLYDRTSTYCKNYGCLNNVDVTIYGYWTVSSYASDSYRAWRVRCTSNVLGRNVSIDSDCGVRPVITVLKSALS